MGWFHKFCRDVGLMVHNIRKPDDEQVERREVARKTEQKREGEITLRRTTIDEIEIKRPPPEESTGKV